MLAAPLLVTVTGVATAHGGGSYDGGMMGGWGIFGGAMGLFGLLWMGLLLAVPFVLVYWLLDRNSGRNDEQPRLILRKRYARGELSEDEFERRREQLERSE